MTAIDPQLLEQLSAWMDGELPADEARFLQRRLRNDVALRGEMRAATVFGQEAGREGTATYTYREYTTDIVFYRKLGS